MKYLKEMANMYSTMYDSYRYMGNCSNSFDGNNGDCLTGIFQDINEFANYDESANFEDIEDSNGCGKIDQEEFLSLVDQSSIPKDIPIDNQTEYHYYDNGVLVIYNPDEDMHYFFSKLSDKKYKFSTFPLY